MRSDKVFPLFALMLSCAATSFAHPMGNFSINHYAKIKVDPGLIEVRYLIDMAEIPSFQEIRQFGFAPVADDPGVSRYLDRQEPLLRKDSRLRATASLSGWIRYPARWRLPTAPEVCLR